MDSVASLKSSKLQNDVNFVNYGCISSKIDNLLHCVAINQKILPRSTV